MIILFFKKDHETYWENHMHAVFKVLDLLLDSASQAWAQMHKTSKLQGRIMNIKLKVNPIKYREKHSYQIKMTKIEVKPEGLCGSLSFPLAL